MRGQFRFSIAKPISGAERYIHFLAGDFRSADAAFVLARGNQLDVRGRLIGFPAPFGLMTHVRSGRVVATPIEQGVEVDFEFQMVTKLFLGPLLLAALVSGILFTEPVARYVTLAVLGPPIFNFAFGYLLAHSRLTRALRQKAAWLANAYNEERAS